ncbi:MAG: hypothetical protein L0Y50_07220 [Beijerinckiaceae bacterium]|nr:hypothetical protein [Beijerinckiaceae bacterium]
MKTSVFLFSMAAALAIGMGATDALGQDRPDQGEVGRLSPQPPAGTVARYRVTYFYSNTSANPPRSVSIVSITNQSAVTCRVAVDWKIGFGGVACATNLLLGAGNTADFCTRSIPVGITACNSTCPGLNFTEGSAIVASSTTTTCDRIAVSARTVYTGSTSDAAISAITDAKVVRFGFGNIGD